MRLEGNTRCMCVVGLLGSLYHLNLRGKSFKRWGVSQNRQPSVAETTKHSDADPKGEMQSSKKWGAFLDSIVFKERQSGSSVSYFRRKYRGRLANSSGMN